MPFKRPKPSAKQQRQLVRTAGTGEYTIADLAELFTVSRTTVYYGDPVTEPRSPG